jgi:hypothetical protein
VVEVDARLVPLFARSFARAEVVARRTPPEAHPAPGEVELQVALGSLCRWRRRKAASFASPRAYLAADAAKVAVIRARYRDVLGPGFKVGIAWRSKTPRWGTVKSAPLAAWAPLLREEQQGVRFVNLQYGEVAADLARIEREFGVRVFDDAEIDQMASLDDFAAQVAALDLVISISNTTVHMAGALGCEVWTMVPFVPDWRWQLGREDTLWYPRMRLFRQPAPGAWEPVLAAAAQALARRLARHRGRGP